MFQEIFIVDSSNNLIKELRRIFKDDKATYKFKNINPNNLDEALKSIIWVFS